MTTSPSRVRTLLRSRRSLLAVAAFATAVAISTEPATHAIGDVHQRYLATTAEYKAANGAWSTFEFPEEFRVNAVHAALLKTGKVLVIAGSGNDEEAFEAGSFKTLLWDPETDDYRLITTPDDLFCAGHAFLPNGDVLIAGGTSRYEVLDGDVTHAAGAITVKNEDPDDEVRQFPEGTRFTGPNGKVYEAAKPFEVAPATKTEHHGGVTVTASETVVWAEAVDAGEASVTEAPGQYAVEGLEGAAVKNVYGMGAAMTLDRQDYQGTKTTYVFSPETEEYLRVSDMEHDRWYPTLVPLADGTVLASSGLDGTGQVLAGQTEVFDPATKAWTVREDLTRYFPTYPWLYPLADGRLFYSGSNSGYGPADEGRQPGIWDLTDNTFEPVTGLEEQDLLETSGSVMLPPVQDQRVMVVGGGGIGESPESTSRTAVADLDAADPSYHAGPHLQHDVRYPNVVNLPDDTVLITGGSGDYRGKGNSDVLATSIYDPATGDLRDVAPPSIGRSYHSEALLLPDGRVVTMGSDLLFADEADTIDAPFEQRLEIYSPPYLFRGDRPVVEDVDAELRRGQQAALATSGPAVESARLMRPSAVTHATDVEQRTVALEVTRSGKGTTLTVPAEAGIVPDGWYMLTVATAGGVPSEARWVHVSG